MRMLKFLITSFITIYATAAQLRLGYSNFFQVILMGIILAINYYLFKQAKDIFEYLILFVICIIQDAYQNNNTIITFGVILLYLNLKNAISQYNCRYSKFYLIKEIFSYKLSDDIACYIFIASMTIIISRISHTGINLAYKYKMFLFSIIPFLISSFILDYLCKLDLSPLKNNNSLNYIS